MKRMLFTTLMVTLLTISGKTQNTFEFALNLADPNITTYKGPCYVHLEESPRKNELVLFLPGKGYQATFYSGFVIQAGKQGYHALALKYVEDPGLDIQVPCGSSADNDCFENARLEGITGEDVSPIVGVNRTNSIENRLIKAIQYLNQTFPGNGWDNFWTGDSTIQWDKIRVVGHEEGAGYAAAIGKKEAVARVVLMGWNDWDANTASVPAWLSNTSATPAANWYGFSHLQDESFLFSRQEATWTALGMDAFGATVNVDATAHPYSNSHMLSTDVTPAFQNNAFNDAVVVSSFVPVVNGNPIFADVWSYLLDGSSSVSIGNEVNRLTLSSYPNPVTDILTVKGEFPGTVQLSVFSIVGQQLTVSWSKTDAQTLQLEVGQLVPGNYFLKIQAGGKTGTQRFVVQ